jgi:segregation and condensation protein B
VQIASTIMRTLQERNWIRVVGHREVPGHPELLGTTREFLDYFGLRSLDQLPTLAELRDVETIGVQLELPGGEVPAEALEIEATSEVAADEADVPVDAAPSEDADDAASPSLVASSDDDDEPRTLTDPPL